MRPPLPNRAIFSITEAGSWIVSGQCLDDEAVREERGRVAKRNTIEWGHPSGPAWLRWHLERLLAGKRWKGAGNARRKRFEQARGWLKLRGCDATEGLRLVEEGVIAEDVELKRYAAFVEVLRSAGAGGTVTVFADRVQSEIASVPSLVADTAPIPPEFFARPITFIPGFGLQQHGDLSSGDPAGPVYVSPVVPRDGVLLLADMFDEATHSDEREPLNKLPTRDHSIRVSTKVWYRDEWVGRKEYLKWLQQRGRPSTSTPSSTDDLNAAREKLGQGVSRELIREARREFAPKAWSKAGKR